ncbi:glycerophosphoryl diester phosphodiesterase [Actinobacteria bacterium IMCC26207]|nr:glycerophosphoryl diester phosphodiesterase [Actinobacteria bacterium IMCC26207]
MSNTHRPLICAHRGASAAYLGNTLEAFHGAREQGADWVELDIRVTSQGELVVHHDATYADGRVVWATLASDRPKEVPTLEQSLQACAGMGVNIEIKNSPGDFGGSEVPEDFSFEGQRVGDLMARVVSSRPQSLSEGQPILVSSFDWPSLQQVRDLLPPLHTAWLFADLDRDPLQLDRSATAGDVAVNPWEPLIDQALMNRCTELGLQVNAWTVDDPDRIRELARLGVSSIITNEPAQARAALGL